MHTICPVNAHFVTRQCNPTMLGFYVPLAHRVLNHRSSVGGSQLLLVLWPRASHLGKELSTIQRPSTQVGHSWVSFGFFFLENTFPHSHSPAILPFLVLLPHQRFLSSCGFPFVLFTVPSLPFSWSYLVQVLLSWIMLSWKLVVIKIRGWLTGISFVLLNVIADIWICFQIGLLLFREMHGVRKAV